MFYSSKKLCFLYPINVNYRIISMDDDVDLRVALSYIVKSRNLGVISGFWLHIYIENSLVQKQKIEIDPVKKCKKIYSSTVMKTILVKACSYSVPFICKDFSLFPEFIFA